MICMQTVQRRIWSTYSGLGNQRAKCIALDAHSAAWAFFQVSTLKVGNYDKSCMDCGNRGVIYSKEQCHSCYFGFKKNAGLEE